MLAGRCASRWRFRPGHRSRTSGRTRSSCSCSCSWTRCRSPTSAALAALRRRRALRRHQRADRAVLSSPLTLTMCAGERRGADRLDRALPDRSQHLGLVALPLATAMLAPCLLRGAAMRRAAGLDRWRAVAVAAIGVTRRRGRHARSAPQRDRRRSSRPACRASGRWSRPRTGGQSRFRGRLGRPTNCRGFKGVARRP